MDLEAINRDLGHQPEALIRWACGLGKPAVLTTSFGPFEAVLLHMVTAVKPDIPIVWMDSGYATPATYRFADTLSRLLKLDLHIYLPRRSRAHREAVENGPPSLDDPRHAAFVEEVKLEPFRRALDELNPGVWFTAIRREQTEHRAGLAPVTLSSDGILKIAPVFPWTTRELDDYLKTYQLPNNFDYFDPTKGDEHRECGLHLYH